MANSVYTINKGINRSIEFKGLKAQYIWYMGGGVVVLLILFAILYICGLSQYLCMLIIFTLGAGLVFKVYDLSRRYGEYGLMKAMARRSVPRIIKCRSRSVFRNLDKAGQQTGSKKQ